MKIINVSDIEELILTKYEIDNLLINHGDRKEKMTLDEFLDNYLNFTNIFMCRDDILDDYVSVAFCVKNVYGNDFLFIASDESNKKATDLMLIKLDNIGYDFSKLKQGNVVDLALTTNSAYFIINNKYYS